MKFLLSATPFGAPVAPAILLFTTFWYQLSEQYDVWLGFFGALAIGLMVEMSGVYIAYGLGTFIQKRQWVKILISAIALLAYGYVGFSVYWGTTIMAIFVLATAVYFVMALMSVTKEQREEQLENAEVQLKIMRERRLRENTAVRRIKAENEAGINMEPVRSQDRTAFEQFNPNPSKQGIVWNWLDSNIKQGEKVPSVRTVCEAVGINSTGTVSKHMKTWKEKS
jgi:uncharacterized membrane protein